MKDYIKETVQAYQDSAEEYSQRSQYKDHTQHLNKFVSSLKGNRILEIGFGDGVDIPWFLEHNYEYIGVEPVPAFYQKAKAAFPQVTLLSTDIRDTEFNPQSFDGIWAMASLLHLNPHDLELVIKKCHSWLTPNGVMYASFKQGAGEQVREGKHFFYYTEGTLGKMYADLFELIEQGFQQALPYNTGKEPWIDLFLRRK